MNFTLRSSSSTFHENERLTRTRPTNTFNRFLSFNENKSSTVENRRRLLQSSPNLIELLEDEEEETEFDDLQGLCHECSSCSKLFASEYGLNHHRNMYHPNQSILCSLCNLTFRSHRSLKTHQQRRHSSIQTLRLKSKTKLNQILPNYSYISSYLVLAFSSEQFPLVAKNACEQERLPLGSFASLLYQCHLCYKSFPCSRTLNYHLSDKHEHYEYNLCEHILYEIILHIEETSRTVNDDDEFESMKLLLAKHASQFGLQDKQLAQKSRSMKNKQNRLIYPTCQHKDRTCANLCLQYLSSYSKLIQNYSYTILTVPKGNPFAQGSIVSHIPSMTAAGATVSNVNGANISQESTNGRQKRRIIKHIDGSSSPQLKKKASANVTATNRSTSNTRPVIVKQEMNQTARINDTKVDQPSFALAITPPTSTTPRKILPKDNYMRSSSISSNSSTSTRSSLTKASSSSTNLTSQTSTSSQRTSKRSLSPSIIISLERSPPKRRRTREQKAKQTSPSSTTSIKINGDDENDIEQENGDDDDIVPIKIEPSNPSRHAKQRQASSGSIEYVQTFDSDLQATSSLNNIENIKSKSKINDEEIIICRSPPSVNKVISSQNKNHSKASINGNTTRKSAAQQPSNNDEHVRVRCKICGEILEGRSRFSKHVMNMHGHLLKKNVAESKQQTAIVR